MLDNKNICICYLDLILKYLIMSGGHGHEAHGGHDDHHAPSGGGGGGGDVMKNPAGFAVGMA